MATNGKGHHVNRTRRPPVRVRVSVLAATWESLAVRGERRWLMPREPFEVNVWSICRDRRRQQAAMAESPDLAPLSQWRTVATNGKDSDVNRTQEVAGSSPASSTTGKACKSGPFVFCTGDTS